MITDAPIDKNRKYNKNEILGIYKNPSLCMDSYAIYSPDRTSVFSMIINFDQNIMVSEKGSCNFICVGEYSHKDFEAVRMYVGGLIDLFVSNPDEKGSYKYWGKRKIKSYTEDQGTLRLFRSFQKEMAQINGIEQALKAVICLTTSSEVEKCEIAFEIDLTEQNFSVDVFNREIFK